MLPNHRRVGEIGTMTRGRTSFEHSGTTLATSWPRKAYVCFPQMGEAVRFASPAGNVAQHPLRKD
jgi:hypothetical protein